MLVALSVMNLQFVLHSNYSNIKSSGAAFSAIHANKYLHIFCLFVFKSFVRKPLKILEIDKHERLRLVFSGAFVFAIRISEQSQPQQMNKV